MDFIMTYVSQPQFGSLELFSEDGDRADSFT